MTPTNNRTVDDYLPRAQLKKAYHSCKCSLEDLDSISQIAQKFVVSEECVKTYLGALEIVGAKEGKEKERETGEVVC